MMDGMMTYKDARQFESDMDRVASHRIKKSEYEELPELTKEMVARATIKRGGRPPSENLRKELTLRSRPFGQSR